MPSFRRLVLGTGNPGKVKELESLLSDLSIELVPGESLDSPPDVEEDAETLEGNAEKKARAYAKYSGMPALADDTGLEVDALNGRPGVHTARFAGPDATPNDNIRHLLDVLEGISERTARFRTVVAIVDGDSVWTFEGTCEGVITRAPRGDRGFGYDPLFQPDGYHHTFAEMPPSEKNEVSHRRKALDAMKQFLAASD